MISLADYEKKRDALSASLRSGGGPVALGKNTSNLFRVREVGSATKKIDVSGFNHVIYIDEKNAIANVEGMTTYETLVEETLKFGFMPPVVPELKTITVGGAASGIGGEATSFRYGLVHETILEMEILLGTGEVVVCSKERNSDLFYGFPNSYGTLGYALRLKVKLIPVKKFVKIEHTRYDNAPAYFSALEKICRSDADFVDGTIFTPTEMYTTVGKFTDEASSVSDYTFMDIYYKSIREKKEDYLTAHDFMWRWDTDWFWCSMHLGMQNKLIRWFLGKERLRSSTYWKIRNFVLRRPLLRLISNSFSDQESIIQDVEIPVENASLFLDFFQKEIGIKPIWVCPIHAYDRNVKYDLYALDPDKLYINFGFWDSVKTQKEKGYYNRLIEKKVAELGGKKSLYSESFYPRDEFWGLYNKKKYDELKAKYDPNRRFKDLYEKCVLRK